MATNGITTFTSESVCSGHPDKICDQISDAILDAVLTQDRFGRVACETLVGFNRVVLSGEITAKAKVDFKKVAQDQIKRLGYTDPKFNFSDKSPIDIHLHEQSPEIAVGVKKRGAGDQGCLKKGTLVRTKKGFIPIEKVKIGDYVATPYGWKKVLESRMTGVKSVINITLTNGMLLTCTKDHKVLCFDKNNNTYWKAAADLQPGEFICTLKPQQSFNNTFRESYIVKSTFYSKYNHKIYGSEKLIFDDKLGYVTGELIGDGYVANHKYMELSFGTNYAHARIVQEMTNCQMPCQWRLITNQNYVSLKIDSILVRKHFQNYGLDFNKAPNKATPDGIYLSPKEVIRNYLRGLFDSDGTIVANTGRNGNNIRIRLGSASHKLLREVQLLLNDFRIKSSILSNAPKGKLVGKIGRNGKTYKSKYDHFVLSLVGFHSYNNFYEEIGFLDDRKQQRLLNYIKDCSGKPANSRGIFLVPHPRKQEFIDETKIGIELPYSIGIFKEKIDRNEIAEVYDLEVEDAHMFSGNGIYVHNSMFGYACKETKQLMPMAIMIAHSLTKRMDQVREEGLVPYLRPDGKSQVTIEYKNGTPTKVLQVVIAIPHEETVTLNKVKKDIYNAVVVPVLDRYGFKIAIKDLIVNGTGVWHHGGPAADCGITGRKIVVDGYGGYARVGGGAFCLAGDSLINTEKGLVRIDSCQEIAKKGLLVKTDVHPMSAAVWYDNGIKPTKLITTKDGYQLEATLNHNIRIIDSNGNYVWRNIEKLKESDWISIQTKNRLFGDDKIPEFNFTYKDGTAEGRKKKYKIPFILTEDYAYLLGLLVGDGDCTDIGCIRICVCEEEMRSIVQNLFERLVEDKGKIYGHWAYLGGVEFRAFLEHLGLTNAKSFEKVVPKSIFSASERNCAAFLRGLFDTDGSIRFDGRNKNTKRIHLATTSKKLAEQVQLLLLNFGIISKIYVTSVSDKRGIIRGRKINSQHTLYNVVLKGSRSIDIFTQKIGFGLSRKNKILAESIPIKRDLRIIPNQRERIRRLFKKLPIVEQRKERDRIGRFIRFSGGKATKELTYEKLKEFIHLYDSILKEDEDYITLKELYYMEHYYSRLQKKIPSFAHTYDLNIPFSHTFTANGIVCHNSGKDPTKVDRSGAYAARFLAKNIVANKLAEKAEVRLAYFIGAKKPSMQDVETFGTNKKSHKVILSFMEKILDTSVSGILEGLDLQRPIYLPTAAYGHFGRDEFPWERIV